MEAHNNAPTTSSGRMVRVRYPENEDRLGRIMYGADTYEHAESRIAGGPNGGPSKQHNIKKKDSQLKITKNSPRNRTFERKQQARELKVVLERIPAEKLLQGISKTCTNPTTSKERTGCTPKRRCGDKVPVVPMFNHIGHVVGFCVSDSSDGSDTSGLEHFQRMPSPVAVSADLFHMRATPVPVNEPENLPGGSQSSGVSREVPHPSRQMPGLTDVRPDIRLVQGQFAEMDDVRNLQRSSVPHMAHQMHGFWPRGPYHQQPVPHDAATHHTFGPGPIGPLRPQPVYCQAAPIHETYGSIATCPRHPSPVIQPPQFQQNVHLHAQQNQIHQYDGSHNHFPYPRPADEFIPAAANMFQPEENMEEHQQEEYQEEEEPHEEDQQAADMQEILRYASAVDSQTRSISQNLNVIQQTVLELRNQHAQTRRLLLELVILLNTSRQH